MRLTAIAMLILGTLLILPGCQNRDDEAALITPEPVPIEEVATSEEHPSRLSWEERGQKAEEYFLKFMKLKDEKPDNAAEAFRKGAALLFSEHPLVPQWSELVIRFDIAGKALLPEMIQLTEIELQMVEEDPVPNKEYLRHLKSELAEWNQLVADLRNAGKDPDKHEVLFESEFE